MRAQTQSQIKILVALKVQLHCFDRRPAYNNEISPTGATINHLDEKVE